MPPESYERVNFKGFDLAALRSLILDPAALAKIHPDDLQEVTFMALGVYGRGLDRDMIGGLDGLFQRFTSERELEERWVLYRSAVQAIEEDEAGCLLLYAFIACETDPHIVASAVIDLVAYFDPGPNGHHQVIEGIVSRVPTAPCPGGIVGGLLLLGDGRFEPMVRTGIAYLDGEGLNQLARCYSGFINHFHVQFLLHVIGYLISEDDSSPVLGHLAAALHNLAAFNVGAEVEFIERGFGMAGTPDAVKVLRAWPVQEYASGVVGQLRSLEAIESEPKVLPAVIQCWETLL